MATQTAATSVRSEPCKVPSPRLGPCGDERGQVEARVAVEHQLVVHDLVGDLGIELVDRHREAWDPHRLAGEDGVDRQLGPVIPGL